MINLFFRQKRKTLLLLIAFLLIFTSVSYLYSQQLEAVGYAFCLSLLLFLVWTIIEFVQFYSRHCCLQKHIQLKKLYTLEVPDASDPIEADYQQLVRKLIEERDELAEQQKNYITESKDYYTLWVHQIKTPISALNLLIQVLEEDRDSADVTMKDLRQELFKIDFYVDAVLQYLRLEDISGDLKFETCSMEAIVKKAVKKFAPQFISRKIRIELRDLAVDVLTDPKWTGFIIEQLLSNAIKYSENGGLVRIYRKETANRNDRIFVIEDHGIGISEEDLPRIFEKGFTGYNGRMNQKSTGIGLYLCKKAANKLSQSITIQSEPTEGTRVYIDMTTCEIRHE